MTDADRLPALVLGGGVTGLGVARALGRHGLAALVAAPGGDLAHRSRWARPVPGPAGWPEPGGLPGWLGALPLERAVLLPCGDGVAREAAALPAPLARRFPVSLPSPAVLDRFVDKAEFSRLLRETGVPGPDTWVLAGPADLDALPDAAFVRGFLKPCDSQRFFRSFGVKAFWVTSREEARGRLAEAAAAGHAMLLQRYVPGGPDAHWFLDGFAGRGGQVHGLLVRQRLRMYPPDFGNSSCMVTTGEAAAAPAVAALRELLAQAGHRGMFSAEFKQDARDGAFRLLEVNARAWWYVGFAANAGMNAPWMAWQDAQGLPVEPIPAIEVGRRCIYPHYDRHAAGRPGLVRWLGSVMRADQPVFALHDPMPALVETGRALVAGVRRRLGRRGA